MKTTLIENGFYIKINDSKKPFILCNYDMYYSFNIYE